MSDKKFPEGASVVKWIRELFSMSQQEFASWLGIAISTVSRWENGKGEPMFTPRQWKLITDKLHDLGYSIQDLPDDWRVTAGQPT
ncbi:MAG: helix-turn-helix domain-containing protein [Leptolyngbyaceae cyanobacterium]